MKMSSKELRSHRFGSPLAALAGLIVVLALPVMMGIGCSIRKIPPASILFLDEAFVSLFPELAAELVPNVPDYSGFSLADLEAARLKAIHQSNISTIIASPLLVAGKSGEQGRIISPFFSSPLTSVSGVKTLLYDYNSAYELMGARAGRATARKGGKKAICAVIFQPNSMRGENTLQAFKEGYARHSYPETLSIVPIEAVEAMVDIGGATMSAIGKALALKPTTIVVALDDAARTIAAMSDAKNIIRFGDVTAWRETEAASDIFDYWLEGNPKGMAALAFRLLESRDEVPETNYVPLLRKARFPRIF